MQNISIKEGIKTGVERRVIARRIVSERKPVRRERTDYSPSSRWITRSRQVNQLIHLFMAFSQIGNKSQSQWNQPRSTHSPTQSITKKGLVRWGRTPRCMILSARVAKALNLSDRPDKRGRSVSHARVKTARWEPSECKDWWMVMLCNRRLGPFVLPTSGEICSSSKNFRQSSFSSLLTWSSPSSDKSTSVDPFFEVCFGFGGFVANSVIQKELSSDCCVGKVVSRSRIESRLAATFSEELFLIKVLREIGFEIYQGMKW